MSRPWRSVAAAALVVSAIAGVSLAAPRQSPPPFPWPNGHRAALSLSFDDGRSSQIDAGVPILGQLGLKVTFYVTPGAIEKRQTAWRAAAQGGHEIGNHSLTHPCSGNFAFARKKALEEYTLARMDGELDQATRDIARITGVTTTSFAYPCGQTFVGRGAETQSYVPLISRRFRSGRLWLGEAANDPTFVDLSQVIAVSMDDRDLDSLRQMIDTAADQGRWLVLAGHDISEQPGPQTTRVSFLKALADYLKVGERGIWVAPVGTVAEWVATHR